MELPKSIYKPLDAGQLAQIKSQSGINYSNNQLIGNQQSGGNNLNDVLQQRLLDLSQKQLTELESIAESLSKIAPKFESIPALSGSAGHRGGGVISADPRLLPATHPERAAEIFDGFERTMKKLTPEKLAKISLPHEQMAPPKLPIAPYTGRDPGMGPSREDVNALRMRYEGGKSALDKALDKEVAENSTGARDISRFKASMAEAAARHAGTPVGQRELKEDILNQERQQKAAQEYDKQRALAQEQIEREKTTAGMSKWGVKLHDAGESLTKFGKNLMTAWGYAGKIIGTGVKGIDIATGLGAQAHPNIGATLDESKKLASASVGGVFSGVTEFVSARLQQWGQAISIWRMDAGPEKEAERERLNKRLGTGVVNDANPLRSYKGLPGGEITSIMGFADITQQRALQVGPAERETMIIEMRNLAKEIGNLADKLPNDNNNIKLPRNEFGRD
jgi:hypothetical protein